MSAACRCWLSLEKHTANGGHYVEKLFCSCESAQSNSVIVHSVAVVVSTELNRKHYFWNNVHVYVHLQTHVVIQNHLSPVLHILKTSVYSSALSSFRVSLSPVP